MRKPLTPYASIVALLMVGALAALRYVWATVQRRPSTAPARRGANDNQPQISAAEPAPSPDPAQPHAIAPAPVHRAATWFENTVLLIVALGLGYAGLVTFNQADDPVVDPPSRLFHIDIGAPGSPRDGGLAALSDHAGLIHVKNVSYYEGTVWRAPEENAVGIGISLKLDRPIVGDLPLRVMVSSLVQDGFTSLSCTDSHAYFGQRLSAEQPSTCEAHPINTVVWATLTTTITKQSTESIAPDDPQDINLQFDVHGLNGIGCRTSRTRAEIQFPSVTLGGNPFYIIDTWTYHGDRTIPVRASYKKPVNLSRMDWSGTSPNNIVAGTATWSYDVGGPHGTNPPPGASGVRTDLIARNGPKTFIAGVLLALAGSAAIPLIQSLSRAAPGLLWRIFNRSRTKRSTS